MSSTAQPEQRQPEQRQPEQRQPEQRQPEQRLSVAARAKVPPFHVMDVLSAANRRQQLVGDVISLAPGQPASPAPAAVRLAAASALQSQTLGYTEQLGIPPLREAIAEHYRHTYDLTVSPSEVVVTTGSSGAFLLAFLAAFSVGDRVALPSPGYPAYRNILTALGAHVVDLPCGPEHGFVPSPRRLAELEDPVRGLVLASPANPTGTMLDPAELAALGDYCSRNGVQLISDEIYHGITFGKQADCAWRSNREAIVVNSFSKYFAMTGWRLGWMLLPQRLARAVDCLAGNFTICAPALSQHAGLAAFSAESRTELDGHVARYRANRALLLDGLAQLGLTGIAPVDGAFYAYVDVSRYTADSLEFCERLLADTGVAIAPGIDFDPVGGRTRVRFSFAGAGSQISEALDRMGRWLPAEHAGPDFSRGRP